MPTLVAQEGHVPRTTGATGTAGEQAMVKSVAAWLRTTRPANWNLRVIGADVPDTDYRGDAFVAIHGDGNSNRSIRGASVGYRSGGKALATAWKAAYEAQGWPGTWHTDNYTTALGGYYGVRKATEQGNDRAFILEVGMMTNAADRAWIDAHHEAIARSIWAAVTGEAPVERTHAAITITDLGDPTHRAALRALAATWKDAIITTAANHVLVHAALGKDADAFIGYAIAHGLSATSITVDGPSYATMVLRSKGLPAPIDVECAAQLAKARDTLGRIKTAGGW